MMVDIIQIVGAAVGGGGLTALLTYVRKSRKDAREDTLTWHTQLMVEQKDWRDMLLRQIDGQGREIEGLRAKLREVQIENVGLRKKIAELEAHNDDLKRDNTALENRVLELERDLKKHDAAAAVRSAGVVGLI